MGESGHNRPYVFPTHDAKLRYVDFNTSTGGIARDTVIASAVTTVIYSQTGAGFLHGFLVSLTSIASTFSVQCTIDGTEPLFSASGIVTRDIITSGLYGLGGLLTQQPLIGIGISGVDPNTVFFSCPNLLPIRYESGVRVDIHLASGTKTFLAGMIVLSKE